MKNPNDSWLTPKRFGWMSAAVLVIVLINCAEKTNNAPAQPQDASRLSGDSKNKLAAIINVNGQLCASVSDVSSLQDDRYLVTCIRYRDGTGSATYVVDLRSGAVK